MCSYTMRNENNEMLTINCPNNKVDVWQLLISNIVIEISLKLCIIFE
jgi:hypothetical protein